MSKRGGRFSNRQAELLGVSNLVIDACVRSMLNLHYSAIPGVKFEEAESLARNVVARTISDILSSREAKKRS